MDKGKRDYDLWITYYGDKPNSYKDICEFYNERKGSKFQNLKYVMDTWPDKINDYSSVLVLDEDILISSNDINRLFKIHAKYNLAISGPSFDPNGKNSYAILINNLFNKISYTNFIETNAPLFSRNALLNFMSVYDGRLIDYGTDIWYSQLYKPENHKLAVIHSVVCKNPYDGEKGIIIREIDTLLPNNKRKDVWKKISKEYDLTVSHNPVVISSMRANL